MMDVLRTTLGLKMVNVYMKLIIDMDIHVGLQSVVNDIRIVYMSEENNILFGKTLVETDKIKK
jgi:hypothetical protein